MNSVEFMVLKEVRSCLGMPAAHSGSLLRSLMKAPTGGSIEETGTLKVIVSYSNNNYNQLLVKNLSSK